MAAPKLRNPKWQAALEIAAPHLDQLNSLLNSNSEDIKALEKYLADSGYRIDTRVTMHEDRFLGWVENIGTWRLCVLMPVEVPEMGKGYEYKPVLETSVATRWDVSEYVPALLQKITTNFAEKAPTQRRTGPADRRSAE